jgi:hypothetical protein
VFAQVFARSRSGTNPSSVGGEQSMPALEAAWRSPNPRESRERY